MSRTRNLVGFESADPTLKQAAFALIDQNPDFYLDLQLVSTHHEIDDAITTEYLGKIRKDRHLFRYKISRRHIVPRHGRYPQESTWIKLELFEQAIRYREHLETFQTLIAGFDYGKKTISGWTINPGDPEHAFCLQRQIDSFSPPEIVHTLLCLFTEAEIMANVIQNFAQQYETSLKAAKQLLHERLIS